jgi:hypothetical protein
VSLTMSASVAAAGTVATATAGTMASTTATTARRRGAMTATTAGGSLAAAAARRVTAAASVVAIGSALPHDGPVQVERRARTAPVTPRLARVGLPPAALGSHAGSRPAAAIGAGAGKPLPTVPIPLCGRGVSPLRPHTPAIARRRRPARGRVSLPVVGRACSVWLSRSRVPGGQGVRSHARAFRVTTGVPGHVVSASRWRRAAPGEKVLAIR